MIIQEHLCLDGTHSPGGPSKFRQILSYQPGPVENTFAQEIPNVPLPEDILKRIKAGEFTPQGTTFRKLGPEEIEALGIKLGSVPGMYDIASPTGDKLTVLTKENAAFVLSPDHPLIHDLQGAMADVLIQNARAQEPILTAKGVNDALKAAGLPVLKNKSPREILEYGAETMGGYQKFLEAQEGVLRAQLKLQQLSAAGDALMTLRKDLGKSGWEMAFTSSVRKQNATLMLRLAFLAAADELVDDKTQETLATVTAVDEGLAQLKINAAKEWVDGMTELAGTSLGNLGEGVKNLVDQIVIKGGGQMTNEAVKILTNLAFGQEAYDEGIVKSLLDKLGVGAEKLEIIARKAGTSVGGLLRGFFDTLTAPRTNGENKSPQEL